MQLQDGNVIAVHTLDELIDNLELVPFGGAAAATKFAPPLPQHSVAPASVAPASTALFRRAQQQQQEQQQQRQQQQKQPQQQTRTKEQHVQSGSQNTSAGSSATVADALTQAERRRQGAASALTATGSVVSAVASPQTAGLGGSGDSSESGDSGAAMMVTQSEARRAGYDKAPPDLRASLASLEAERAARAQRRAARDESLLALSSETESDSSELPSPHEEPQVTPLSAKRKQLARLGQYERIGPDLLPPRPRRVATIDDGNDAYLAGTVEDSGGAADTPGKLNKLVTGFSTVSYTPLPEKSRITPERQKITYEELSVQDLSTIDAAYAKPDASLVNQSEDLFASFAGR